jgi:hypothetical protein
LYAPEEIGGREARREADSNNHHELKGKAKGGDEADDVGEREHGRDAVAGRHLLLLPTNPLKLHKLLRPTTH